MFNSKEFITVSGNIRVRPTRGSAGNLDVPLSLLHVRVQSKHKLGVWRDLGDTTTDFNGHFSVTSNERERDRRFRIDVRMKSEDLSVRGPVLADWDTLLEQPDVRGDDLENVVLIYGAKSASSADATDSLDDAKERERAELWGIARGVLKMLDDLGKPFVGRLIRPYRLEIVSPPILNEDHGVGERQGVLSYAGPASRNVHIQPGESRHNIIHEIMHVWAYDHTRALVGGQAGMIPGDLSGRTTHELQEWVSTAFHEGFAEFAANQIESLAPGAVPPLPKSRAGLAALPIRSVAEMLKNDTSWESILTTLVTRNLHTFDFGTADDGGSLRIRPNGLREADGISPSTTFQGILGCFAAAEKVGVEHRLSRSDMTDLSTFVHRVTSIARGLMLGREEGLLRVLDPAETIEPRELFAT